MAIHILRQPCVVSYFSQEQFPADVLATLARCSKDCHQAYKAVLAHRRLLYIEPRWVAYVLWQPDIQPHPGVSVASLRRLQRAMSLTREQLTDVYLSQDNFLMFLEEEGKPIRADTDMQSYLKDFEKAMLLVDASERDRQKLTGQIKKALSRIPLFLLRLLVARDCHQGRVIDHAYDKFLDE